MGGGCISAMPFNKGLLSHLPLPEWRTETASAGNTDSKEGTGGESEDQKPGKLRHKLMTVRPELLEKFIK